MLSIQTLRNALRAPSAALLATTVLLVAACAPEESRTNVLSALNGRSSTTVPSNSNSVTTAGSSSSDTSAQIAALFGTYTANLQRLSDGVNVPVTLEISRKTVNGTEYAFLVASCTQDEDTDCNGVEFSVSSYLSYVGLGSNYHALTSGTVLVDGISEANVAFELILKVSAQTGGTYSVDSPQSSLFLKDCGFYESSSGAACSNQSADATFLGDAVVKQ